MTKKPAKTLTDIMIMIIITTMQFYALQSHVQGPGN